MSSPVPRRRRIEAEDVGCVTVVGFVDRKLLEGNIPSIGDDLCRLVDDLGRRNLLLDFGALTFWSSAALGTLVTLHRKLRAVQGRMALCNVAPDGRLVFTGTKLDRILNVVTEPALTTRADVIREVFGDPHRPVACDPRWRTDTAVALAHGIHESGDFGAMPILADALQDAGCDDEQVLSHCRAEGVPHVRGCWVLDVVLGRE